MFFDKQNNSDYRPSGARDGYRPNQNGNGYAAQNSYAQQANYNADQMTRNEYMTKTFRWMAIGLLVTFAFSVFTAFTGLLNLVYALYLPLTIAELVMVFVLSARVQKMQVGTARALFLGYAALNGMVMSIYFLMFEVGSLILAFFAAGVYFGLMAAYGALTQRDLSAWGPKLMMGLVALMVCGFIGMFTGFGFMTSLLYSGVGLVIFMLLTAYDTQKLNHYYNYYAGSGEMLQKTAIFGALQLYLDFINIFIFLLRMFGKRRD